MPVFGRHHKTVLQPAIELQQVEQHVMAQRVTNADLAEKLDKLAERVSAFDKQLAVIETEARVAKWVLRAIAGLVTLLIGKALARHWGIEI